MENRLFGRIALAGSFGLFLLVFTLPMVSAEETMEIKYQFVCNNDGFGLSVVDVLQASGDHDIFLNLFSRYDPEGYAILSDPELADKTVWAPTDTAFLSISDSLSSLSEEEIRTILGYHISPPRRAPFSGSYPILTPQYLLDAGNMSHRTRTGVLSGSDQRTQTMVDNGVLTIEGVRIENISWYTEAGSVFSLDGVIMNVQDPSVLVKTINRIVHILLYDDIRFVIYSTVIAVLISLIISRIVIGINKRKKKDKTV
ncbi:MAG: fasciclin domain-containing protein [Spirochaetia bacterium]|nr:fasciclin domain-containing protein [Spirochaetia bacterium]MCF7953290.1 fasciclin domain-containing protein [Spirochaetales bacterium]MCF8232758.1 fasciclin domain-containing protein [Bacteroidales bacterium]